MQVFLNEKCKDAMNIMDFVNTMTLQLSDLEDVGELGYVEGISKIIIRKLDWLEHTTPIPADSYLAAGCDTIVYLSYYQPCLLWWFTVNLVRVSAYDRVDAGGSLLGLSPVGLVYIFRWLELS
mgnify:CR=1 FL=1